VGRAIAVALGARGMQVVVHYHGSEEGARETASMIERAGGLAVTIAGDLRDPAVPETLVAAAQDRFDALDLLVNSAAVMERTPFGSVTAEQWDAMFALNLRAPFLLSQVAADALGRREGAIVNIADLAAFESWPAYVPHGITKAGVVQLTRSLARVLAPRVRVNAVAPGAVLLPADWGEASRDHLIATTPLRRLGSPDDVAHAVIYLAEADYVTGETLIVDGGRHVRQ
jgi:pteridine reductase